MFIPTNRFLHILPLVLVVLFFSGCKQRFEYEVVGRIFSRGGHIIQEGEAEFCYRIYDQRTGKVTAKDRCRREKLSVLSADGEWVSFIDKVKGKVTTPLPYFAFWLKLNGMVYPGSIVRQVGFHKEKDKVYRGRAVIEFYPK